MNVIGITTSKYSTLFRCILTKYKSGAEIHIDRKIYTESDVDDLLSKWCTNRNIKETHNFKLIIQGRVLFSFHDGPEHLWGALSELPFIEYLRDEHILRYETPQSHIDDKRSD